jgi:hypothetical protein
MARSGTKVDHRVGPASSPVRLVAQLGPDPRRVAATEIHGVAHLGGHDGTRGISGTALNAGGAVRKGA